MRLMSLPWLMQPPNGADASSLAMGDLGRALKSVELCVAEIYDSRLRRAGVIRG